ncbi:hypothetical protein JKP88DRAFT_279595 [Tribonema minus]|uniref:Uncharacterized protein n=1 Tax=Tribonema minus TaxID=303371 RepID=A0A835YSM8_9STRA|nr:hypothetical protein JKP88DRAFT_279595 [Tribonema minus]
MAPQPTPADTPAPAATDVSATIAAATAAPTSPSTATTTTTPAGADASDLSKSELLERLRKQRAAVEAGHRTQKQRSVERFFATICIAWVVLKRQQREVQMLQTEFVQLNKEYAEEQDAATADRVELRQLRQAQIPGGQQQRPADARRELETAHRENALLRATLRTRDGVHARRLKTLGGNSESSDDALASAAVALVLAHEAQLTARVTADARQHRRAWSADLVFMKQGILRGVVPGAESESFTYES